MPTPSPRPTPSTAETKPRYDWFDYSAIAIFAFWVGLITWMVVTNW
jgi:hypothetical protein